MRLMTLVPAPLALFLLIASTPALATKRPPAVINSERLVIEPLQHTDAEFGRRLLTDEKVMENANGQFSPELIKVILTEAMAGNRDWLAGKSPAALIWSVKRKNDQQAVGIIFAELTLNGYWETSTLLVPHEWKRGYGLEARKAMLPFFFEQLSVPGLIATISANNVASAKISQNLGFSLVSDKVMSDDRREFTRDPSIPWHEYRLTPEAYRRRNCLEKTSELGKP